MPKPRLIHPIEVTIEPLNRAGMVMDDDAREPMNGARGGTTYKIQAQIRWQDKDQPNAQRGGVRETSRGYILVETEAMRTLGKTLARGDRITQIGSDDNALPVNLFLGEQEPLGHY